MYFLRFIHHSSCLQFRLLAWAPQETTGSTSGDTPKTPVESQTDVPLSPESQEAIAGLQEQLDSLQAAWGIVHKDVKILWRFLEKVANGEVAGCDVNDTEFQELMQHHANKIAELQKLADEGQMISHVISREIASLKWNIEKTTDIDIDTFWENDSQTEVSEESETQLTGEERQHLEELESQYNVYKEAIAMKLTPFMQSLDENSESMNDIITRFRKLDQSRDKDENGNTSEAIRLNNLENGTLDIVKQLSVEVDIIVRDESIWESWQEFSEKRLETVYKNYEELLENEELKEIITPQEWETPTFDELKIYNLYSLQEKGVDISTLLLTWENGEKFSWEFVEGENYIMNFGNNVDISQNINLSFIIWDIQQIRLDGTVYTFKWDNYFDVNGNTPVLQDGLKISIAETFWDEWSTEAQQRSAQIQESFDQYNLWSVQQQAVSEALMSDNPEALFEWTSFPGWFLGSIMKAFSEFFEGKNYEFNDETGRWEEMTNEEVVNASQWQYSYQGQNFDYSADFENIDASEWVKSLVNVIYQAESRGNPNIIYAVCKIKPPKPITEMTVREVRRFQDRMVASGSKSSAVGACQIIRGTMDGAIASGILDPNEKFDLEAQTRFTLAKMNERWLSKFKRGEMTQEKFMYNLACEWASLPKDMWWQSKYAGDGLNHALVSPETIVNHLRKIKSEA